MAPTFTKSTNFTVIMSQISPSIVDSINDGGSPQHLAYQWLVKDPDYYTYSETRIVQRWVLAVFKIKTATSSQRRADRRLNEALDTWMEYTNECEWFTSWYENRVACNAKGQYRNLILRNIGLEGTIPSELNLLSNLRKFLILMMFPFINPSSK